MGPQVQPKCFRHLKHMRKNWELRKRGYLIRFGHTEALLFLKKKKDIKRPFFPPCRNWPICGIFESMILLSRCFTRVPQKVTGPTMSSQRFGFETSWQIADYYFSKRLTLPHRTRKQWSSLWSSSSFCSSPSLPFSMSREKRRVFVCFPYILILARSNPFSW